MTDTRIPRIISVDDHVVEPPDLWTSRLPSKYADRAPRVERDQYGRISRVFVSARTAAGLEGLRGAIVEFARDRAAARGAAPSEPLSLHHTH